MRHLSTLTSFAIVAAISASAFGHQAGYYVTERGKTYHKMDCKSIKGKKVHMVTADEARKHKLKPCKICKPV